MKKNPSPILASAFALTCAGLFAQELPTNGILESPLGPLEVKNGYPTGETVATLYDALDFQRACQAYLWALPSARATSITWITSTTRTSSGC
jgi:hypothetical protein